MLWPPKQNLGYISQVHLFTLVSIVLGFKSVFTIRYRNKAWKYLKSHKCIYLAQWATLVSFWALCEKFTQFWIALIFGTLSSSSCRPAWAFFAAYRVRQIFDVTKSRLSLFFSFSSIYDGRCETIVTKKNERKKLAVLLFFEPSILFHLFLKIGLE